MRIGVWAVRIILTIFVALVIYASMLFSNFESFHTLEAAAGFTSFYFVLIALSIGPIATLFPSLSGFVVHRRSFGVWAFLLTCLHLVFVFVVVLNSDIGEIIDQGLYTIIGLAAWLVMIPLAATSFDWAVKMLSYPKWKILQRLAYVAVILIALHITLAITIHTPIYLSFFDKPKHVNRLPLDIIFVYLPFTTMLLLQIAGFVRRREIIARAESARAKQVQKPALQSNVQTEETKTTTPPRSEA